MRVVISRTGAVRLAAAVAVAALAATAVPSGAVAPVRAAAAADACGNAQTPGATPLFDGTAKSLEGWKHAGPGSFALNTTDCTLTSDGGLGLFWYAAKGFQSYTLTLDWKIQKLADNSGVFVGFPGTGGTNAHNLAISNGYEIQIDQLGRSDGAPKHITGAIYDLQGPNTDTRTSVSKPLDWNRYEITVDNPKITVKLNGVVVNEYLSVSLRRDLTKPTYIGLQAHGTGDTSMFRNIQVTELVPGTGGGGGVVPLALTSLRNNVGIDQGPTSNSNFDGGGFSYSAVALAAAGVRGGTQITSGGFTYTWPSSSAGQTDNVIAGGQALKVDVPAGSTKLGLLTSSTNGPSNAVFTAVYKDEREEDGTREVELPVTISDWTLNGGGASPSQGNTVAVSTIMRSTGGGTGQPERVPTNVFSVSLPLDPSAELLYVLLPKSYNGLIHLFDVKAAK